LVVRGWWFVVGGSWLVVGGSTLNTVMTRIGVRLILLIAIAATIGCDRVTKHVAAITLSEAPSRSFLAGTFRLEYTENEGAFLGLGADWPPAIRTVVFGVGNGLLLIGLTVLAIRARWPRWALVGVALFVAGGASNLVDRIAYGTVIDFMNVGIGSLRTGIFNVADMAIMLGAGILVLEGYRSNRHALPKGPG
jgi:signal peptidase II